jgi:hypothetical protein
MRFFSVNEYCWVALVMGRAPRLSFGRVAAAVGDAWN